jgi:outer membrane PBP1 activator LpoA protein
MLIKKVKVRVFIALVTIMFLCQCAKVVNSTEPTVEVQSKKLQAPYPLPVTTYLSMAMNQEGAEKQNSLISAAGRLIFEGQLHKGATILSQLSNLTDDQQNEKNLLLAKVDLIRDKPKEALVKLSKITNKDHLSPPNLIEYHEQLAKAFRTVGNYKESIDQRIQLEALIPDQEGQINNRRILWLTLANLPQADLDTMSSESASQTEFKGWVQLALISRKYRQNSKSLLAVLDQWQSRYSSHPGNQILPTPLDSITDKLVTTPKQIALILPLSGQLAGPGQAIKDGFMASYKANKGEELTKIKLYDSNKEKIEDLYQKAVAEGAEYVVGPLTKDHVNKIASINHPVPTLLLNETTTSEQNNSYSLSLSPIDEATQVAIRARAKGLKRALIIAPNNQWGDEIISAFSKQWKDQGGLIIDSFRYAGKDDLNKGIRNVLQIPDSEGREKKIKQLLGYNLQTNNTRRQDVDMIFMLAYPSKARQIMPLLKYYFAGSIPVYATSSVYSGNANALKDKDLDGLIFCDIPWVFSHQMAAKNWPEQFNSYNRLYALGMDSYSLATQMNQLILFPSDGSTYTSGILFLKPTQRVARVLEWGQFKEGMPHSLGDTV